MIPKRLPRIWAAIAPVPGLRLWQSALIAIAAGAAAFALVTAPRIHAQAPPSTAAPLPSFEVASIKLNHSGGFSMHKVTASGFRMINLNTRFLIEYAYGHRSIPPYDTLRPSQVMGGPSWINTERYDVDAKVEDTLGEKFHKDLPDKNGSDSPGQEVTDQIRLMVQSLLAERFNLKVHREMREAPVLALVVAEGGPKFLNTTFPERDAAMRDPSQPPPRLPPCPPGMWCAIRRASMSELAPMLWDLGEHQWLPDIGRPVIDQTGIKGDYDIQLQWAPQQGPGTMPMEPNDGNPGGGAAAPPEPSGPSIFTALKEQLGLKLESTKGPVEYVVVDHVERPTEN